MDHNHLMPIEIPSNSKNDRNKEISLKCKWSEVVSQQEYVVLYCTNAVVQFLAAAVPSAVWIHALSRSLVC